MDDVIRVLVTGAVSGSIFSLIASGLVLTYTATGIFNLGYGGVAFSSAFVYYELNSGLHWNRFVAAIFVVFVLAPALGVLLNAAVYRPLARASEAAKIVATVGILVALPALTKFIIETGIDTFGWGVPRGDEVYLTPGVLFQPAHNWTFPGDIVINSNQMLVLASALACAIGLWVFSRTTLGLRMRAVVDRNELAGLRGVDEGRTSLVAAMIGTALAALGGVVGAPILNSLEPGTYMLGVFLASSAAVFGRFASVPGAFVGGLLVGILMSAVFRYVEVPGIRQFNNAVPFLILLGGLVVLGVRRGRSAGSTSTETRPPDWASDLPPWRRVLGPGVAFALLAIWMLFVLDDYWSGLVVRGLAFSIILLSITIVTGLGGLVSLAQAVFATGGALTAGLLLTRYEMPYLVALVGGVAVAVLCGLVVALPSLRLGGLAFTLATLALAFLSQSVLFDWTFLGNGDQGWSIDRPAIGGHSLDDDRVLGLVLLAVVLLVVLLIRNLERSSAGRAIFVVRSTEVGASSVGLSPVVSKLRLFAVAAAIAGLGGVLLATVDGGVTKSSTNAVTGFTWLTIVVLLGVSRPAAAVAGGIFLIVFPQLLGGGFQLPGDVFSWDGTRSAQIPAILFGLGAIDLARNPGGVLAKVAEQNRHRRDARRARAEGAGVVVAAPLAGGMARATISARPVADTARAIADAALVVDGLHAGYGLVKVLHDVELTVPTGSITALLGPNGAGKSTLCRVVGGSITPTAGSVALFGADITTRPDHARVPLGLMVAPESRGIFPALTVEDNLRLVLASRTERDEAYARFPVLGDRRRIAAGLLSGGEQQMLSLVPLLVRPPRLLVADEPTLGLAPTIVEDVLTVLTELRDRGTTILIAEEKARTVLDIADRVALMSIGRVVWSGAAGDVDSDLLDRAYLVAEAVAEPDPAVDDAPLPVEEVSVR